MVTGQACSDMLLVIGLCSTGQNYSYIESWLSQFERPGQNMIKLSLSTLKLYR